jgi:hypothetical protein
MNQPAKHFGFLDRLPALTIYFPYEQRTLSGIRHVRVKKQEEEE